MKENETAIISNDPIKTVFNGTTYLWHEAPRREQRKVKVALAKVASLIPGIDSADQSDQLHLTIDVVYAILEFCEDHNADFLADIDSIEAYIDANGVDAFTSLLKDVFMPVFNKWLLPMISKKDTKKKAVKKKR